MSIVVTNFDRGTASPVAKTGGTDIPLGADFFADILSRERLNNGVSQEALTSVARFGEENRELALSEDRADLDFEILPPPPCSTSPSSTCWRSAWQRC